jgi:uncharacterized protein (TIGR04222 family)
MVAAVVISLWLRRAVAHGSERAWPELDPCAVGYLAKGASHAAEVVIVALVESGALRADSSGGLTIAGDWELAIAGKGGPGIPDDLAGRAALAGFGAVPDRATRAALEAGMPEPAHSACGGCGG